MLDAWLAGPPERAIPCAFTCTKLDELAVGPMLERIEAVPPPLRVQFMESVARRHRVQRELLLTVLEPLLKERDVAGSEGPSGPLRTCDMAYVLVRRAVKPNAEEAGAFSTPETFTALDPDARVEEIDRWLRSATWLALFPPD